MMRERRQRVESLCLEAVARNADSRAAFLDTACAGDAELRRDVDSLLAGQASAAAFLEQPAWQAPSTPLTPGTHLGPYGIDAAIGAGNS
jgi:serine/threonine-protein kinase